MITKIASILEGVKTIAIAGHVRPDGDCIGSCMGMYLYVKENYPEIQADVYLESFRNVFSYIEDISLTKQEWQESKSYDLLLLFDVSSLDRVGVAEEAIRSAKKTVCIDHHMTNQGVADVNHIVPDASSTCEVLYELLEEDKITKKIAEALYTGIVHDTGVFQHSCTGTRTMEIAGKLMGKGIPFTDIIKNSFYMKSYAQNKIMADTIANSYLLAEGKCIVGILTKNKMEEFGVSAKDLDGIVNQLQNTEGVEVALFLYELEEGTYKVSLRSNGKVNVAQVAAGYAGGGHIFASGCTVQGEADHIADLLSKEIEKQL